MGWAFKEFFAGGGMVRAGLGPGWKCIFANDNDAKKAAAYVQNWGASEFLQADVASLSADQISTRANLIWASFPCKDLSQAGAGAGLSGQHSGTFWPFWQLVGDLRSRAQHPDLIALENVCGTLASHSGRDFSAICQALVSEGFDVGAVVLDACRFLPHSRPRLFVVGVRRGLTLPPTVYCSKPVTHLHPPSLCAAVQKLPDGVRNRWIWWFLPEPSAGIPALADILEPQPSTVPWHSADQTCALMRMMALGSLAKVNAARRLGGLQMGAVYKRMRTERGQKRQRAEVRFDMAGCLRTPRGGSSRQILLFVEPQQIRSRLISPREAARLMGLSEGYRLPGSYYDAYELVGDGVAVPVVRHLRDHLFEKVLEATSMP